MVLLGIRWVALCLRAGRRRLAKFHSMMCMFTVLEPFLALLNRADADYIRFRNPPVAQILSLPPKTPAEAPFRSLQVTAHAPGPLGGVGVGIGGSNPGALGSEPGNDSPFGMLRTLARGYVVSSSPANGEQLTKIQMCQRNAEVCLEHPYIGMTLPYSPISFILGCCARW